jgi:hypothetical protein
MGPCPHTYEMVGSLVRQKVDYFTHFVHFEIVFDRHQGLLARVNFPRTVYRSPAGRTVLSCLNLTLGLVWILTWSQFEPWLSSDA